MNPDMHKDVQNAVCFTLGRQDADQGADRVTLHDVLFAALFFVDIYVVDQAAHQLAVYIIVPFMGIVR